MELPPMLLFLVTMSLLIATSCVCFAKVVAAEQNDRHYWRCRNGREAAVAASAGQ